MRLSLLVSVALLAGAPAAMAPAFAQEPISCDASADKDGVGEFDITYNLDKDGNLKGIIASFTPERMDDASDSDFFGKPRILLNYKLSDTGEITSLTTSQLLLTKYKGAYGDMSVKATADAEAPLTWKGNESRTGEEKLADLLRDKKPKKLNIQLIGKDGKAVWGNASFDLSKPEEIQALATKARTDAEKMKDDAKAAVAGGKALTKCPV
ncbi:MAG TPA: hypothetical protein VG942_13030 [Hyphomonadaceae bacterium]|nr:hypothetical protein [Hyphomonadaceae bacterium]